ncbi:MAG: GNAT family N-acetyltransferase [archaeon]
MKDVQATIIIDLEGRNAEDLLKQADRSRRKNISKAKDSGLIFKEADEQEFQEYHRIYSSVWKDGGVNPEPIGKLMQHKDYKLFVAKKDKKVIGGGLIEIRKGGINFVAFASSMEYQEMRVNDFLYWNCILYALNRKMRYVDLGGYQLKPRGHMQGINTFKEKWGGRIVMREVNGNILYLLGRKAIRNVPAARWLWDRIKGRPVSAKDKRE